MQENVQKNFLFELGVEELPAEAIGRLTHVLADTFRLELNELKLNHGTITTYGTPRRIACLVQEIDARQIDETQVVRGPSVKVAIDAQGMPTQAGERFAQSCNIDFKALNQIETPKGDYLVHERFKAGQELEELLPQVIEKAIKNMATGKSMRWSDTTHRFLRPVQWITALLDTNVLPCNFFNKSSDRLTYGHRIHYPQAIELNHALEYDHKLKQIGYVIPQIQDRKEIILGQIESISKSLHMSAQFNTNLINEITNLVEWPVVLVGTFDESFLNVPHECLISTMEQNQRYLSLLQPDGNLSNRFLFVANLESLNPQAIIEGNERVIRPRFADAHFFYNSDLKIPLVDRREALKKVVFQKKLGSLWDKTERMSQLSQKFATELSIDVHLAQQAGELSKSDLMSQMVGEFPELQGIMGRYYGQAQGLNPKIAQALEEQYLPRGQGDALPNSELGVCLSLADKFDSLVGFFGIGKSPTSDKDPFALRRKALGIVRICIELEKKINVEHYAQQAFAIYPSGILQNNTVAQVVEFIMDRLPTLYRDSGKSMQLVQAVQAVQGHCPSQPYDFNKRFLVLEQFLSRPEAELLAAAHKRVNNMLKKTKVSQLPVVDISLLTEPCEIELFEKIRHFDSELTNELNAKDYASILEKTARLKEPIDAFFDNVQIMADEKNIRQNRLSVLACLQKQLACVGNLSYLAVGS